MSTLVRHSCALGSWTGPCMQVTFITVFIRENHKAVSVGVAVELSRDDRAVFSENLHQFLVIVLPHCWGSRCVRKIPHWNVCYDVHLKGNMRGDT